MPKHGKQYRNKIENLDRSVLMNLDDAVKAVVNASYAKFDETFDIAMKLGVDPRHADQMVRSSVVLPHGTGKVTRVLVFAKGEKEAEAREAGADYVGGDELVAKIQGGWLEFDKTVATPDMMGTVGKIGRVLGPRNLMPNAKLGTVTFDVANIIKEIKGGKVDFRVDKAGIVHAGLGKISFGDAKLLDNVKAFIEKIIQLKPSSSKGIYLKSISVSSTMGAGFKVDPLSARAMVK
ncbi:MAG: 50S ribosomal protein L1 [Proteobacteria bacterium]|jgi:large subunit ribosomal protein L1|nr:50S ribosomal protein L1 [Desulfocapsa sp.]MBU3943626.1 50S ribosomal protein L1 [Pseudomonadota bacterium]MCG2744599.1 50S ribosomal protein L1 [Desulfobacteraceae bacterium]MDO8948468.1 50S ribosomal protein L1 [Desulfocapsaceae bacterium]MBU3983755.1 50S ribosomal protein L1 [Pseudomonadota bacterium]